MNIYSKYKNKIDQRCNNKNVLHVRVNDIVVSDENPVFVIAEAANNHMCSIARAKEMVDKAVESGVNAIKFQTYKAEKLARKGATLYWNGKETSQLEYYSRLDKFEEEDYRELFLYANKRGIIPFSTPFDVSSAIMLNDIGVDMFKVASCDITDHRLLKCIANFNKPVIISTGASTPDEIDSAIDIFYKEGNFNIILLACMLSYPTPDKDANLRRITALKERYPWMVIGLSDHTEPDENMIIPSLAVALGAKVIEKHYTLDRTMTGSGHFFSVDPDNLKDMVNNIRLTEITLGSKELVVDKVEMAARENARRSIVADQSISKGTIITSRMLGMKRPADGLPGNMIDKVIGRAAIDDIGQDQIITLDLLD